MRNHPFVAIVASLLILGSSCSANAQVVTLVAGPDTGAKLAEPFAVSFDPSGTPLVAEYGGHRVSKIDNKGHLVAVAGSGRRGYSGDGGPAPSAEFRDIHNIVQ